MAYFIGRRRMGVALVLLTLLLGSFAGSAAQDGDFPPAPIENDEGGPVAITGEVTYTNPFFPLGVSEPIIILEDQAGFVDRNKYFLMPEESQVMGQITSDFFTSPFTYSLTLPIEPKASLRDVDQDGEADTGVMVYAVAYWTNTWGDPFLEERDLYGGGWSTAYASTRVSEAASTLMEYTGGIILVYAPDDRQGFPGGFGADGLLFTEDDPMVRLPQGYTVVNMDSDPFTFDRSRNPVIDLIEPEGSVLNDFSGMGYTEAFDAMIDLWRREYAFSELKSIDWDAKIAEFRPRFETAEANDDYDAYLRALRDFIWSIPDGHHGMPLVGSLYNEFVDNVIGGIGLAIRALDDGRVIVNYLIDGGPAEEAGIELGAEILSLAGSPISKAIAETVPWESPNSSQHVQRLQQLRYVTRFPYGTDVDVKYINPGGGDSQAVTLTATDETDSYYFSALGADVTGFELPVEYELLDSGYLYASVYSFSDNSRLTIELWERLIQTANDNDVSGMIIDMRQNGGGDGFLADQMAAYFFDEALSLGISGSYNEETGDFYFDPRGEQRFYLPPPELRYLGDVAVLVGPNCASACEYFTYDMTLENRAAIVGQYPTAGLGGGQKIFVMPPDISLQFSVSRTVDSEGNIIIEGHGIAPTVRVPVTEETLFSEGDPILDAAVDWLDEQ